MGLGLAKECKERFPLVYQSYRKRCKSGNFNLLTLDFYLLRDDYGLMLVPTKYEWRHGSRVEWVDNVLYKFSRCLPRSPIKTLHVPPLGCGAGGLLLPGADVHRLLRRRGRAVARHERRQGRLPRQGRPLHDRGPCRLRTRSARGRRMVEPHHPSRTSGGRT